MIEPTSLPLLLPLWWPGAVVNIISLLLQDGVSVLELRKLFRTILILNERPLKVCPSSSPLIVKTRSSSISSSLHLLVCRCTATLDANRQAAHLSPWTHRVLRVQRCHHRIGTRTALSVRNLVWFLPPRQFHSFSFSLSLSLQGLLLPSINQWPINGYTFSTWLWVDSFSDPSGKPLEYFPYLFRYDALALAVRFQLVVESNSWLGHTISHVSSNVG